MRSYTIFFPQPSNDTVPRLHDCADIDLALENCLPLDCNQLGVHRLLLVWRFVPIRCGIIKSPHGGLVRVGMAGVLYPSTHGHGVDFSSDGVVLVVEDNRPIVFLTEC